MAINNTIPDIYDIKSKYGSWNYDFWVPIATTEEEIEQGLDAFERLVIMRSKGTHAKLEEFPMDERTSLMVLHRGVDFKN